jgi:HEPN domain-containing protein
MQKNKIFREWFPPFYIDTRYPVHWPTHYDGETAVNAMKAAKKIRDWIKTTLK